MTAGYLATGTILDRILERTAADLAERKQKRSLMDLDRLAGGRSTPVSLRDALAGPELAVIAEIKRASPSRGRFPVEIDPPAVAHDYLDGGAAALSVLTDEPFFQGSLADMEAAAAVAHAGDRAAPVLRKDFIIDSYQIHEARAFGADAILLIVAALEQSLLVDLLQAAQELGLSVLVEVHDEAETQRALAAGASIVGINNRDLRTFNVDLAVTERLAPRVPPSAILVGESGIFTAEDATRLANVGVDAVLVGESLIVSPDRAVAIGALRGVAVTARG